MQPDAILNSGSQTLEEFLAAHEKRAYRMAEMATGQSQEALDIVQDAMFALVRQYSDLSAEARAPVFYRILHNRINDWHRRNKVRRRWFSWFDTSHDDSAQGFDPDVIMDERYDPVTKVADTDFTAALVDALRDLPLRQREAFLLRAWQGFDVRETAEIMGCSEGSVKTHYSRALATLKPKLEAHYHDV